MKIIQISFSSDGADNNVLVETDSTDAEQKIAPIGYDRLVQIFGCAANALGQEIVSLRPLVLREEE